MSEDKDNESTVQAGGTDAPSVAETSGDTSGNIGGDTAAKPATAPDAATSGRRSKSAGPSVTMFRLALAGVVIAVLLAGFFWWQGQSSLSGLVEQDRELRDALAASVARIDEFEASIAGVQDSLAAGETRLAASENALTGFGDDLSALPPELRDLERRVDALQGGRVDARDIWLREQAEYYLVLANTELTLGRRIGTAIEALELADTVLRQLGNPDLARVRAAVSAELQSLRAIEQPDLARMAGDLAGLATRVFELPLRTQAPENFVAVAEAGEDEEPGLGRLWSRTQGAMRSMVRVERQEEPVGQLLTESERRIVRRQLALELTLARAALLDGRQSDFRASLVAADGLLNTEFNRESQSIVSARELIGAMMRVELQPALPAIGDSLSLLRSAPGAD